VQSLTGTRALHPPVHHFRNSLATLIAISATNASDFLPNFKEIGPMVR
jgi:hypothetical protein